MKINQQIINNLKDKDFIRILIINDSNIEIISDEREVIQYENDANFYVKFNYTVKFVKKCLFFSTPFILNKTIIDKVFFKTANDAEFYMLNAKCPSLPMGNTANFSMWQKIYLTGEIGKAYADANIQMDAAYDQKKKKLYFGKYHTNDFNNVFIKDAIDDINKSHNIHLNSNYRTIKTMHVDDILSEKENSINMLKKNFNENKDTLNNIIIDEIDRTKEYLNFLIKLIN